MKKLRKATGHILKLIPIWDIREHSGWMLPELSTNNHGPLLEGLIPLQGWRRSKALSKWNNTTL